MLTNSNYIVRKVCTNYTHCVHRIRFRPITPQYTVEGLDNVNQSNLVPDPSTGQVSEPAPFDQTLQDFLADRTSFTADNVDDTPAVVFYHVPRRVPQAPPLVHRNYRHRRLAWYPLRVYRRLYMPYLNLKSFLTATTHH